MESNQDLNGKWGPWAYFSFFIPSGCKLPGGIFVIFVASSEIVHINMLQFSLNGGYVEEIKVEAGFTW